MTRKAKIVSLAVVLFSVLLLHPSISNGQEAVEETGENPDQMVLYVQEGCSHCAKVEAFIEENGLEGEFIIKDTSVDEGASEEYVEDLERLGVSLEESGVPMLVYDNDQYLTGDTPIISFLQERFSITPSDDGEIVADASDVVILTAGVLFVGGILGYGIVKIVNDRKSKN